MAKPKDYADPERRRLDDVTQNQVGGKTNTEHQRSNDNETTDRDNRLVGSVAPDLLFLHPHVPDNVERPGHSATVSLLTISSAIASALAAICCGAGPGSDAARNGVKARASQRAGLDSRRSGESVVATGTAGIPRFSKPIVSCKLHVVHDPQSASPSTTASIRAQLFDDLWRRVLGECRLFGAQNFRCSILPFSIILPAGQERIAAGLADIEQPNLFALQAGQSRRRLWPLLGTLSFPWMNNRYWHALLLFIPANWIGHHLAAPPVRLTNYRSRQKTFLQYLPPQRC